MTIVASTFSFNSEPAIGPVKTNARNVVLVAGLKSCRVITLPSFLAVWIAALTYSAACGQDAGTPEALRLITETASQICQAPPLEQTNNGLDLSGDAKAKVGGIVGKIAGLGISGGAEYQSEHSAGVLQKDLITAIQSGNNCKLQVFLTLEHDLLGAKKSTPDVQSEEKVIESPVNFTVPNSEQYCKRLKSVLDSGNKGFKPIIGSPGGLPGQLKPKVQLPNMEWCWLNTMPAMEGQKAIIYYSCEVFVDEKSQNAAAVKLFAYIKLTSECLGKDWIYDDVHDTGSKNEKGTSFKREPEDPTVVFRTHEGEGGTYMVIYVNHP